MQSEIGDLEEMGWGSGRIWGSNHETVCRVWGLLGSELRNSYIGFGHPHRPSTLFLGCFIVSFTAIMTQDTETRPLNILIVGAGNSSNNKCILLNRG